MDLDKVQQRVVILGRQALAERISQFAAPEHALMLSAVAITARSLSVMSSRCMMSQYGPRTT